MTYNLNQFQASEKVTDGKFTGIIGIKDPATRGLIFENDELVSVSFGNSPTITTTDPSVLQHHLKETTAITTCFEGPLVKVWWDSEGEIHLSTTNKLDCTNSYWGNKEERFGRLFYDNGGSKFVETCQFKDLTHHFMIMTNSLMVTSDIDLKDNDCVVIYLGSVHKTAAYYNVMFDDEVFCMQPFSSIPDKSDMRGRILYPYTWEPEHEDLIHQTLKYGPNPLAHYCPLPEHYEMKGIDMPMVQSYLGSPIILRCQKEIVKVIPESYDKKCRIIGNSPNIKLLVFTMMDACKPKLATSMDYFERFDFFFVPSPGFMEKLETSSNIKKSIIVEYFKLGSYGFMMAKEPKNATYRELNLVLILCMCLPQFKAKKVLEAYKDYVSSKKKIKNFIRRHLRDVIDGKFDETLNVHDTRVSYRMKDMAYHADKYASGKQPYGKSLDFSLTGLLDNERGASLYRIDKTLSKNK